jgi:hypothetical protein
MTVWVASTFLLAGVVLSLLRVQWACRAPRPPTRFSDIAGALPSRTGRISNIAIALLLIGGVALLLADEPWWVRWSAFLATAAATAGLQTLALRLFRRGEAPASSAGR